MMIVWIQLKHKEYDLVVQVALVVVRVVWEVRPPVQISDSDYSDSSISSFELF